MGGQQGAPGEPLLLFVAGLPFFLPHPLVTQQVAV